jgi:hypothetical protein
MKTRSLTLVVLTLFAAQTLVFAANTDTAKTKPILEKGMEGPAIIQAYGKPSEIQPMKNPDTNAEKWIYRRKVAQTVLQTANTQTTIPAFVGFNASGPVIDQIAVPDYRLKYIEAYQVTALLMIDGKLQLGRQWIEEEEKFAN